MADTSRSGTAALRVGEALLRRFSVHRPEPGGPVAVSGSLKLIA
ncbi:hypothetical protein [Streptomyces olivaceiscleroticus]